MKVLVREKCKQNKKIILHKTGKKIKTVKTYPLFIVISINFSFY